MVSLELQLYTRDSAKIGYNQAVAVFGGTVAVLVGGGGASEVLKTIQVCLVLIPKGCMHYL